MTDKIHIDQLKEAIIIIDNETLRLRDNIKETKEVSDRTMQEKLYKIKDNVLAKLREERLLYTLGYCIQEESGKKHRLFINKIGSKDDDTIIYSKSRYMSQNKRRKHPLENKGTIGLIEPQEINSKLELSEAIQILERYAPFDKKEDSKNKINNINNKDKKPKENKTKKPSHKTKKFKIKETKLVELSRLKVVRDVHINGNLNPILTELKRKELKEMVANNKNKYPKEKAILVHKAKDPEDKRRIVYNIEDGYRRSLLASELGLDKVYVNIIDE